MPARVWRERLAPGDFVKKVTKWAKKEPPTTGRGNGPCEGPSGVTIGGREGASRSAGNRFVFGRAAGHDGVGRRVSRVTRGVGMGTRLKQLLAQGKLVRV